MGDGVGERWHALQALPQARRVMLLVHMEDEQEGAWIKVGCSWGSVIGRFGSCAPSCCQRSQSTDVDRAGVPCGGAPAF